MKKRIKELRKLRQGKSRAEQIRINKLIKKLKEKDE